MQDFMLIYKGGDPKWIERTEAEKAVVMGRWGQWMEKLGKEGRLVTGGSPLGFEGKRLTKDGVVTDVALSELKELVTGYSIIRAENFDEAVKLSGDCPIFVNPDARIEIRAVIAM